VGTEAPRSAAAGAAGVSVPVTEAVAAAVLPGVEWVAAISAGAGHPGAAPGLWRAATPNPGALAGTGLSVPANAPASLGTPQANNTAMKRLDGKACLTDILVYYRAIRTSKPLLRSKSFRLEEFF
jgi:hypothetical protein